MNQIRQEDVRMALHRMKRPVSALTLSTRLKTSERAVRRHLATLYKAGEATREFVYEGSVGRYQYVLAEPAA